MGYPTIEEILMICNNHMLVRTSGVLKYVIISRKNYYHRGNCLAGSTKILSTRDLWIALVYWYKRINMVWTNNTFRNPHFFTMLQRRCEELGEHGKK